MKSWAKKPVSSNDKNITAWVETDLMVQQQHATQGALWLLRKGRGSSVTHHKEPTAAIWSENTRIQIKLLTSTDL